MEDYQESPQEDGNVWTSNSDLFMAIAVVFLIMFVFSMLAAGIQKAEVVREQREQEAYDEGTAVSKKILTNLPKDHTFALLVPTFFSPNQPISSNYLNKFKG